jgi:hypothetical protein
MLLFIRLFSTGRLASATCCAADKVKPSLKTDNRRKTACSCSVSIAHVESSTERSDGFDSGGFGCENFAAALQPFDDLFAGQQPHPIGGEFDAERKARHQLTNAVDGVLLPVQ